jgi:hypothetical protein
MREVDDLMDFGCFLGLLIWIAWQIFKGLFYLFAYLVKLLVILIQYFCQMIGWTVYMLWRGISIMGRFIWKKNKHNWQPKIDAVVKPIKMRYNRFVNLSICRMINKYIFKPLLFVLNNIWQWLE